MRPLKLAIVGCGAIVENNHLPALRSCPEWQITCLVDATKERAERLAGQYGCQGVTDISQIPQGIDAVLVAVPNHLHGDIAGYFLRKGCHVLCEKPLTITSREAEQLQALSVEYKRLLVVGHQLRFLPSVQQLRALLQSGQLGKIQSVDLAMGWASEWQSVSNFYQDRALAGGGVMLDLGCHLLDLAHYLFGEIASANCLGVEFDENSGSLEKAICVELSFDDGFKGLLRVSRLANLNNAIRVCGESGQIVASLEGASLDIMASEISLCKEGRTAQLQLAENDPFISVWYNFHRSILTGSRAAPDLCYAESGVSAIKTIESLYTQMHRHAG